MSNDWRLGFKKAFIDVLLRDGHLLKDSESDRTYGWEADYTREGQAKIRQISTGEIDYEATTWEESTWHEFMGTFYEGDTRVKGIDLRIVLKTKEEFDWRWSGSVGDLITAVINEAGR